jgi:hypothetical protein
LRHSGSTANKAIGQQVHRDLTWIEQWLTYSRESKVGSEVPIIESHHRQLRWDLQLAIAGSLKDTSRKYIAVREYGLGLICDLQKFVAGLATRLHAVECIRNVPIGKLMFRSRQFSSKAA